MESSSLWGLGLGMGGGLGNCYLYFKAFSIIWLLKTICIIIKIKINKQTQLSLCKFVSAKSPDINEAGKTSLGLGMERPSPHLLPPTPLFRKHWIWAVPRTLPPYLFFFVKKLRKEGRWSLGVHGHSHGASWTQGNFNSLTKAALTPNETPFSFMLLDGSSDYSYPMLGPLPGCGQGLSACFLVSRSLLASLPPSTP